MESAKGKASRNSLVALIKRDKLLELSRRGDEKLGGEGSMPMRDERKTISSLVEIVEEKVLQYSGVDNELMEGVPEFLRDKEKDSCNSWVVEMDTVRWKQHCIYRLLEFIKKMTSGDAYLPPIFFRLAPCTTTSPTSCQWRSTRNRRFCIWLTVLGSLCRSSSWPSVKWLMTLWLPTTTSWMRYGVERTRVALWK
ncbi:unnamed protein product [Urochloa humidicola]